jgi:hypothetical protein
MSSRAFVVAETAHVAPFNWSDVPSPRLQRLYAPDEATAPQAHFDATPSPPVPPTQQLALVERDAFAKGYEQGERAGAEAAGKRGEAMLRRLAETRTQLPRRLISTRRASESQYDDTRGLSITSFTKATTRARGSRCAPIRISTIPELLIETSTSPLDQTTSTRSCLSHW